jgi:hypothetical protein
MLMLLFPLVHFHPPQVLQMHLDPPRLDVQNQDAGALEEALARQEIEAAKPLQPLQVECLVLIEMLRGYSPKLKSEMHLSDHVQSKMGVEVVSVEIIWHGTLQQRYFHVPEMCKHLSKATRTSVVYTVNRENQDSKLADFVEKATVTLAELKHQEWLKQLGLVKFFSRSNQNLVRHLFLVLLYSLPPSRPPCASLYTPSSNVSFPIVQATWYTFGINIIINLIYLLNLRYEVTKCANPYLAGIDDDGYDNAAKADGSWDGHPSCAMACYQDGLDMGPPNYDPCPDLQNQGYMPVWESVHESQAMLTTLGILNVVQISLSCFTLLLFLVVRAPVTYRVEHDSKVQDHSPVPSLEAFLSVWTKSLTGYYVFYVVVALLGLKYPIANSLLLYDILIKNPTSRDVLLAVVIPIKQLMATVVLGVFTVYSFSLIIYENFQDDLPLAGPIGSGETRRRCQTLLSCFQFTLGEGLRNGGGVGDVLLGDKMGMRFIVDLVFFLLVIIILLNIIFGIIIDTFSELREEKKERQLDITEKCFICNIDKSVFDMVGNGVFTRHIEEEHSMWAYLSFMVFLRNQDKDDDDGIEQYVRQCMETSDIGWFPVNKAMSLVFDEEEGTLEAVTKMDTKMDTVTAAVAAMTAKFEGVTTAVGAMQNRLTSLEDVTRGGGFAVGAGGPGPRGASPSPPPVRARADTQTEGLLPAPGSCA